MIDPRIRIGRGSLMYAPLRTSFSVHESSRSLNVAADVKDMLIKSSTAGNEYAIWKGEECGTEKSADGSKTPWSVRFRVAATQLARSSLQEG